MSNLVGQHLLFDGEDSAQKYAAQCGGHFVPNPNVHVAVDLGTGVMLHSMCFVPDKIQPMKAVSAF